MSRRFVSIASLSALLFSTITNAQSASLLPPDWIRYEGGPVSFGESATEILIADSGEVTMIGSSTLVSTGDDVVVARYSATGDLLWSRRFDSPEHGTDRPFSAVMAPDGGLWFTVLHNGVGETRAELVRLNVMGDTVWSHEMSVTGEDGVGASILNPRVAVDLAHGAPRVFLGVGDAGGFRVLRLDDAGVVQWSEFWESGRPIGDRLDGVAVDKTGSVYLAGREGLTLGYGTIAYDADGVFLFHDHESGEINSAPIDALIAAHPEGGVVVTAGPETTCGLSEVRTWRLSPSGDRLLNVVVPDGPCGNTHGPTALAVAPDGHIAIGASLRLQTGWRIFLYKPAGELAWDTNWENTNSSGEAPGAMAFDPRGGVVVTGARQPAPTNGGLGILRYTPAGEMDWFLELPNPDAGGGTALAVSPQGMVAVGGTSYGGTTVGARAVTMRFSPPCPAHFDIDSDFDVDLNDFTDFNDCLAGPAGGLGAGCSCFDVDNNGDIGMLDFAELQAIFTGGL